MQKNAAPLLRLVWFQWLILTMLALVLCSGCKKSDGFGAQYPDMVDPEAPRADYGYETAANDGASESDADTAASFASSGDAVEDSIALLTDPKDERTAAVGPSNAKPQPTKATAGSSPPQGSAPEQPVATDVLPIQQLLIYTGSFQMAVFEVEKAISTVEDLARASGGFLANRDSHQITIRVPAARFDEIVKEIAKMGDVLHREVQVDDVTEQFMDVSIRLKNARAVRERILQLLANAKTVEESIKVEQELRRLSAEIERMEGRLKLLTNRIQMSTITVRFETTRTSERQTKFRLPFSWLSRLGLGRLMDFQ